jgi:hypothetical protein
MAEVELHAGDLQWAAFSHNRSLFLWRTSRPAGSIEIWDRLMLPRAIWIGEACQTAA